MDALIALCIMYIRQLIPWIKTKIKSISLAKQDIFFQYTSLEYLVKTHAITIGGANNVLLVLKDAYSQTCKWYSHVLKR